MSNSWAKPGAKCVCIKRGAWRHESGHASLDQDPTRDDICEIDRTYTSGISGKLMLVLKGFGRWGYNSSEFRPLVPAKTQAEDVALIKSLLAKTPEHAQ